jgi:hypothetical protein
MNAPSAILEEYESITFEVDTPDGRMFVIIMENDKGEPVQLQITIGKAGTAMTAWAYAVSALCSDLLPIKGVNGLLVLLSEITSNRQAARLEDGAMVRSGPDGISYALLRYKAMKFEELKRKFGGLEMSEDDRPARLA